MSHYVLCPFFGYEKRVSIGCEGRPPKSFRSKEARQAFMEEHGCCTFDYITKCEHAKKLQQRYENRDNK